ncbi:MAG TPA: alpha-E domain-containing protein [Stellaceae bacterium]|nr:alpha-E domain-containing protein [Stellaceae bacterium]
MSAQGDLPAAAARSGYLLSRYAESIFWLARYMERIENLARILDVTETFARDDRAGRNWLSVVQINSDEERFFARHEQATAQAVTQFYVLDRENPTSIASTLFYARENARTLRPLISTEMWMQLNVFHNWVRRLGEEDIQPSRLSRLCVRLKESCQAHTGITDGTFFRDQGWSFYMIGKFLERGDQTTRLVDIKYHTLLPAHQPVGSPLDESQWNAVLRAAAGYHAFRRIYPRGMAPTAVAGFLLLNNAFPRSLVLCMRQVEWYLSEVRTRYGLRRGEPALERLYGLSTALAQRAIDEIIADGLHEFLDWVQRELILVHGDIAGAFWAAG